LIACAIVSDGCAGPPWKLLRRHNAIAFYRPLVVLREFRKHLAGAVTAATLFAAVPASAEDVGVGVGVGPVGAGVTVGVGHDRDRDRDRTTVIREREEPRDKTVIIKRDREREPDRKVIIDR
jgi:hypothetical protein